MARKTALPPKLRRAARPLADLPAAEGAALAGALQRGMDSPGARRLAALVRISRLRAGLEALTEPPAPKPKPKPAPKPEPEPEPVEEIIPEPVAPPPPPREATLTKIDPEDPSLSLLFQALSADAEDDPDPNAGEPKG